MNQWRNEHSSRDQLGHQLAFTKSDTDGEVLMRELITYELEKRREQISPLQLMEALGVACFSRICDFAISITFGEDDLQGLSPGSRGSDLGGVAPSSGLTCRRRGWGARS
jgi:hypothetical protein